MDQTPTPVPQAPQPTPVTPPAMPPVMPAAVPTKPRTRWLALLVVALVLIGAYVAFAYTQSMWPFSAPQATTAGPGEHCGGNIANPLQCGPGYHCAPTPGSTLPFGDVGGTCVVNAPSPSASAWKNCANSSYHYSFQYPSEWQVFEHNAGEFQPATCTNGGAEIVLALSIADTGINSFNLDVQNQDSFKGTIYAGATTLDQYFQKNPAILQARPIIKELSLDGERMVELADHSFLAFHNSTLYEFHLYGSIPETTALQILSTFKFTTLPAGWKTYTNTQYGFSFDYPPTATLGSYGTGYAFLTLNEGGVISFEVGNILSKDYNFSAPVQTTIGTLAATKYTYQATGKCHGILLDIPSGEGDRGFLIDYNDCYVGGGSPTFPTPLQVAVFNNIANTFRLTK